MSRATPDDQLKFLLSCVRHSNNGKIDFVEVARECGVVSKGAAAKRYERLLKANGIHPNGGPTEKQTTPTTPRQKSKAEIAKAAAAKKRKIEGESFDFKVDDDDEFKPLLKAEPMEEPWVKPEPDMGFTPYFCQPTTGPPQQTFFPTTPFSAIRNQSSFAPPTYRYVPNRQSGLYQPAPPQYRQVAYPSMSHVPKPTPQSTPVPLQQQISTAPKPASPTVPEDQIQSMYDEFCSQDMQKTSTFDWPSSTSAPVTSISTNIAASTQSVTPELSPHTVDVFAATSLELRSGNTDSQLSIIVPDVPLAGVEGTATAPATVPVPTGKDIDDSILIID